jgi:hypothetical protein
MSPAFFWRIGRTDARWTQLETSMPRGRKGEKRIADVIGATVMVAKGRDREMVADHQGGEH